MTDSEKIKQLIEQAEELIKIHITSSKPEFRAWHSKVERFLTYKYGQKSVELKNFRNRLFSPLTRIVGSQHDDSIECVRGLETTILELKDYLAEEEECSRQVIEGATEEIVSDSKVFIVHGHDGELKEAIARLIESQGIQAVILSEQANRGKTIIEKFEEHSDVGAAIALFTNDDVGKAKDSDAESPRARQNVVFEAGYFMGKFGRDRVIIIAEKNVELPSDLQGVVYTDKADWKLDVCRELKAMNFAIDFNKLF